MVSVNADSKYAVTYVYDNGKEGGKGFKTLEETKTYFNKLKSKRVEKGNGIYAEMLKRDGNKWKTIDNFQMAVV